MDQNEFEALMADTTKTIDGEIIWAEDEHHSPALEFRREVHSEAGYPLYAKGYLNRAARKLTYSLIHRAEGNIYRLDLGRVHDNPSGERVGEKHKHRWDEQMGMKDAYVPSDITANVDRPQDVWTQFCAEAQLTHNGAMNPPPPQQLDLLS